MSKFEIGQINGKVSLTSSEVMGFRSDDGRALCWSAWHLYLREWGRGRRDKSWICNSSPTCKQIVQGTGRWLEVGHCLDTVLRIERIGNWRTASHPRGGFSWCSGPVFWWGRHCEGIPFCGNSCMMSRLAWRVLILGERSSAKSWTDSYWGRRSNVWLTSMPKMSILPNLSINHPEGVPVSDVIEGSLVTHWDDLQSECHFYNFFDSD